MKTIFICEICGNKSENRKEIEECEGQGTKHKFSIEQKVDFLWAPRGIKRWMEAKVARIEFEKATHRPLYGLKAIKAVNPDEENSVSKEMRGAIVGSEEKHIRLNKRS